ncbi:MAG: signal peptidase I [Candidatus Nomurabacteria bacterium]|nr:signal peptidase I [Candidatus Nomurabacteria bacterium]
METTKTKMQSFWEIVRFTLIAVIIVLPIRWFIADPFVVSGLSMFPTFNNGDYLIVDQLSYELGSPTRGDVVIFKYPLDPKNDPTRNFVVRFFDPGKYYIKRVIGLPNETVDIKGSAVTITNAENKKGFTLDEPYVKNTSDNNIHFVLKSDEYFVMGDNRSGSSDSRFWGPVKKEFFTGKAFLRLLPINKIGVLPGYYQQTSK